MKEYKTVVDRVRELGDWPLWVTLTQDQETRIEHMMKVCSHACSAPTSQKGLTNEELEYEDRQTLHYIRLLFHVVEDEVLVPLTELRATGKHWLRDGTEREADCAKKRADSKKASLARKLYTMLNGSNTGLVANFIAQDEIRVENAKHPAHTKTRELLLGEIVREWQETPDEVVADELFAFIVSSVVVPAEWPQYREITMKTIREYDRFCSTERIERGLQRIQSEQLGIGARDRSAHAALGSLFTILAIGWIRGLCGKEKQTMNLVDIHHSLTNEASLPAWELVMDYAKVVGEIDNSARSLIQHIGGTLFTYNWKVGKLDPLKKKVEIVRILDHNERYEKQGIAELDEAVNKSCGWTNPHPGVVVTVTVRVMKKGNVIWENWYTVR